MVNNNNQEQISFSTLLSRITSLNPTVSLGQVSEVHGPSIKAQIPLAAIGDVVSIKLRNLPDQNEDILAMVVGFSATHAILSPFGPTTGIRPGSGIISHNQPLKVLLGKHLLGAVVNARGCLLSPSPEKTDLKFLKAETFWDGLEHRPPPVLERARIDKKMITGIRAIDAFATLGQGQRVGIFAEPGVGKSTLMGMIARHSTGDVNVIGLIGERAREVGEFWNQTIDQETKSRSVLVVSTSNESAADRLTAALTATRIAEYFRDFGLSVVLQIDSLTRLFRAYREVGLAAGEIPVRRGYPPSVFEKLPQLLERAGTSQRGSITAFYTVLLSAELEEDPMVEEVKGLLDGHIILRRELAERGHFPAIDVLTSLSRLQTQLRNQNDLKAIYRIQYLLSRLKKDRDLALLGASIDRDLQLAMNIEPHLQEFLVQDTYARSSWEETNTLLADLMKYAS